MERDEQTFAELFRTYGPTALRLANRLVKHPATAEEVVQDAFLALWRAPQSYRADRGSIKTWVMAAVHHRAVDRVRTEVAQRNALWRWRWLDRPREDAAEEAVERVALPELRARIRASLAALPAVQRQVLEMMYFDGKSQARIAAELALPLGTVKSRAALGMRRLRWLLQETAGEAA